MDYAKGNPNVWDFNGYCFALNALKFDSIKLVLETKIV